MGLNWLDIVVVCIIIAGILDGMSKGLIVSLFNIVGFLIALIIARYATGIAASFIIHNTSIYSSLVDTFSKKISTLNPMTLSLLKLFNYNQTTMQESLASILINIACFFCIFVIVIILVNIVKGTLKFAVDKTPIKYVDRLGGAGVGFVKAIIVLFILFAVLTPFLGILPQGGAISAAIDSSVFAKYFMLYNFLIPWLQKMKLF